MAELKGRDEVPLIWTPAPGNLSGSWTPACLCHTKLAGPLVLANVLGDCFLVVGGSIPGFVFVGTDLPGEGPVPGLRVPTRSAGKFFDNAFRRPDFWAAWGPTLVCMSVYFKCDVCVCDVCAVVLCVCCMMWMCVYLVRVVCVLC